jgi:hypothetical protein
LAVTQRGLLADRALTRTTALHAAPANADVPADSAVARVGRERRALAEAGDLAEGANDRRAGARGCKRKPCPQMAPQEPQLVGLVARSTHWPLHVAGRWPRQPHFPDTHWSPLGQASPQVPQLLRVGGQSHARAIAVGRAGAAARRAFSLRADVAGGANEAALTAVRGARRHVDAEAVAEGRPHGRTRTRRPRKKRPTDRRARRRRSWLGSPSGLRSRRCSRSCP